MRVSCACAEHELHDPLERLRRDLEAAPGAMRDADVREQQAEVVVDFGDRPDRRPRVGSGGLLLDGNRRREPLDQVDVRLFHLLEELARVRGQRLDIPPLPLGVDGVESERRLAGPRQPGDDDEPLARQVDVDIAEVVDARAAHRNPVMRHVGSESCDEARTGDPRPGRSARTQTGNCTRTPAGDDPWRRTAERDVAPEFGGRGDPDFGHGAGRSHVAPGLQMCLDFRCAGTPDVVPGLQSRPAAAADCPAGGCARTRKQSRAPARRRAISRTVPTRGMAARP